MVICYIICMLNKKNNYLFNAKRIFAQVTINSLNSLGDLWELVFMKILLLIK